MFVLLDNGQDLDQCAEELGCKVGQLLTPLTRYRLRNPDLFAIDNGGYSGFDADAFMALLRREEERKDACLFVTVPDVVASARRTLEIFERWRPKLIGWKVALVVQDGQESLPIPWDDIDAVFIGGTTSWKCSPYVEQIIKAAQILEKWVHAGRVNDPRRFKHFEDLGVNSCDGTGLARYTHMRRAISARDDQKELTL
jgi:hypothetical protein